ncbi:MAG: antibiotic biosynthesis monooxygenase [Chloroflexi bacterium]|nr:antibiotic biosynthesis monooxygenase [Chloroflexota bacterium]
MAVRIFIERTAKSDKRADLSVVLRELRGRALHQPGYISGETLVSATNPARFLVMSIWFTLSDWDAWESHPERREITDKIRPLLVSEPKTEIWMEISTLGAAP